MKKVTIALGVIASIAIFANAENIDGTLAVDSGNALAELQPSAEQQLSANLDNNGFDQDSAKNEVEASTTPISTGSVGGLNYQEGPFVGIEGSAVLGSEAEGSNGGLLSTSGMSWGIRFGAQNTEWRTMAILEKYGSDDTDNSYLRGLLQLDYYFLGMDNLMIDTYALRPYAGVNAGAISLDTQTENVKTLTYGGQLGATMNVTQNVDLDVGYRYNLTASDKIDHTHGIAVGLHYKY